MSRFLSVCEVVLPVVVFILVGIAGRKRNWFSAESVADMKWIAINVCIPAVLIRAFYTMAFGWQEGAALITMALSTLVCFGLGFIVSKALGVDESISPYLCTTIEGGGVGYPFYILLFGAAELYHIALLDIGNAIMQWVVIMSILTITRKGSMSLSTLKDSVANSVNAAILTGLILSISGFGVSITTSAVGPLVSTLLDTLATPTSALIMISIGYEMDFSKIDVRTLGRGIASRMLVSLPVCLVVLFIMSRIFPGDALYRYATILFYMLPPSFAFGAYSENEREGAYIAGILALYTLVSIVGFAVLAWFVA